MSCFQTAPSIRCKIGFTFAILLALLLWSMLSSFSAMASNPAQSLADDVSQQAPGSISGRVTDGNGRPVAGIGVHLFANDSASAERNGSTVEDGTYRFDFLGAGLYRLGFADPEGRFVQKFYQDGAFLEFAETIFVASNDVQVADIQLTRGSAIEGTVRTTDGQPLSYLSIILSQKVNVGEETELKNVRTLQPTIITPTNTISYTLNGLSTGLYRVCATGTISVTNVAARNCYDQAGGEVTDAQDISVTVGMTTSNIDIDLTEPTFAMISGTVTSPNGEPLPNIYVSALISDTQLGWRHMGRNVNTDAAGQYRLQNLNAGLYTLQFANLNQSFMVQFLGNALKSENAEQIVLSTGEDRPNVNFVFLGPATASGTVTSETGAPLPDIAVQAYITTTQSGAAPAYSTAASSATTDESGNYQLPSLFPGTYTIRFSSSADQYIDEFLGNASTADIASNFSVGLGDVRTELDFVARTGATVTGTVTLDGKPFSRRFQAQAHRFDGDEWVEITASSFQTADGKFRLGGLIPGQYKFVVVASFDDVKIYQCFGSKAFATATEVELEIGSEIQNIDVDLETDVFDGELGGRVNYQGAPVENILVEIDRRPDGRHLPTIELVTDADGRFHVEGVTPGSYCIRFSDPTGLYATSNLGKERPGDSCDRIPLQAGESKANLGHTLALGGTIRGRVTDYDGRPAEQIEVTAYVYEGLTQKWGSTNIKTSADENGAYTLAGLLPNSYRLGFRYVNAQGNAAQSGEYYGGGKDIDLARSVRVQSGQETPDINYVLGASAHLKPSILIPFVIQTP